MDKSFWLEIFQNAADEIDKGILSRKGLEVATGLYGDSVFLKLYKQSWASASQDLLTAETRIFFSIWINDSAATKKKLFYNIHALKLRHLKGYSIASRKFAECFRGHFAQFERQWPNISLNFGPLTLMEGWIQTSTGKLREEVIELANNFLELESLIDKTLAEFKVQA